MEEVKLLDHGYIKVIETWGSDQRIVEAARMSTDKGFLGWGPEVEYKCPECGYVRMTNRPVNEHFICPNHIQPITMPYRLVHHGDERLLKYLWDHKHATPFEMAGMIIEVQAPIVVFREWHRHRTWSYNEMSGRYTVLPDLYYVPSLDRMMGAKQSTSNKQSSEGGLSHGQAVEFRSAIEQSYRDARGQYEFMINQGVAREVARLVLPVAQYSRMRAQANLRNLLAFLTLRMDPAAQWEIRQYADALGGFIQEQFPHTWNLFQHSH